ncbi:MAG: YvcK family protein [Cyanobacteria bacterium]|nr:YvcK family protein [Cyanobacteriota bacterium]
MGLALFLNLHPITLAIDLFKYLAPYFPAHYSGPLLVLLGVLLLYIGSKKAYSTVFTAITPDGKDPDLLEALYRRNKLDHGPHVVALGGGTGLSTLLRGMKHYTSNITAIVTVGDDGGSSGRLREEQGVIPPGDIRNCIAALADEEQLITELFQYRFKFGQGLEGHSFGNLFLTAMCQITGDMVSAIKESSKVLSIRGRVLPSTLDNVSLVAEMEDGSIVRGESQIPKAKGKIKKLFCEPSSLKAFPDAIKAIQHADLILLGPGSLYTSVMPNLLIQDISLALSQSKAPKVYIVNIMTQQGETDDYTVADHLEAIFQHSPYKNLIDCVLVNSWLPEALVKKYEKANCSVVSLDMERCQSIGVQVLQKLLIDEGEQTIIRHHPKRLARSIIHWFKREYRKKVITLNTSENTVESIAIEQIQDDDTDIKKNSPPSDNSNPLGAMGS